MSESLKLKRDCDATLIPDGTAVVLPAGTAVEITQDVGGFYTVRGQDGLYRIADKNADALGLSTVTGPAPTTQTPVEKEAKAQTPTGPVTEQQVWEILKDCYDPEIPVNIVDLGLVYDLHIENLPGGHSKVLVKMTLTAPGCGMGGVIAGDAQQRILLLPGVEEASVEVVWDPPWHQSMITLEGRRALGLE